MYSAESSNVLKYLESAKKYNKKICTIIYSDFVIPLELRRIKDLMEGTIICGHSKTIRGREFNLDFPQTLQEQRSSIVDDNLLLILFLPSLSLSNVCHFTFTMPSK